MPETKTGYPNRIFYSRNEALLPAIGSEEEKMLFRDMQSGFAAQFENTYPNPLEAKTVVIIPSLTLDQEILQKIEGVVHYEERMLALLMLLRMPRTHVIFVTSVPVDPIIIDYYLHLLPGITGYHARQRLTLHSCFDASHLSLTEKILARPRLINRIRQSIPAGQLAHIVCFNVTAHERRLAVELGLPIYGCDPELYHLGNKSNSRKVFRNCGIQLPNGFEDLSSKEEVAEALIKLKKENPALQKAVVKMNEGFSGDGNAIYYYPDAMTGQNLTLENILDSIPYALKMVAGNLPYEVFLQKFEKDGGIVEAFLEGHEKTSPSVQCRINPLGRIEIVSTHDQMLGGESGQVFLGANFPADIAYAPALGEMGRKVAEALRDQGVLGRFSIDFISTKQPDGRWSHFAIEINLRKGGTTHPYLMLDFLTQGDYNAENGIYQMANGQPRYYFSSDNLHESVFRGLTPHDLIDIAMIHELRYDGSTQEGVVFHLIGALSQHGKLGVVCIGSTPERAQMFFNKTFNTLMNECR